jgi:protein-tyrosine-phosphatase
MAAAWLTHLAGDRVEVRSADSNPGDDVNPAAAVEAMREAGIDISAEVPKMLTVDAVRESDVRITLVAATRARPSKASGTQTGSWRARPARASRPCARSATRSRCWSRA